MPSTIQKLLFIDTNIWLDFYRAQSGAGLKLLGNVEAIKDKIIVTYQLESEFKSNRQKVLLSSWSELKPPSGIGLPNIVADAKNTEMLSKAMRDVQKRVTSLKKHLAAVISKPTIHDPVYKACQRIFHRPGDPIVLSRDSNLKRQIRTKALRRFLHGCPPRKREDVTIGDAFNWEWMVHCAIEQKAELVIVTRDHDFGAILGDESYLNDHLKQEFQERVSKRRKIILCGRLTEALKHFKIKITQKEVQAEAEVVRASDEEAVASGGRDTAYRSIMDLFGKNAPELQRPRRSARKKASDAKTVPSDPAVEVPALPPPAAEGPVN